MGFETSAAYALIGLAVLSAFSTMYGSFSAATEQVSEAVEDEQVRSHEMRQTNIRITGADYTGNTLEVLVKNTGDTALSLSATDLLVDGRYISERARDSSVANSTTTDVWVRERTLELQVDLTNTTPTRVKIVTEHGVAAVAPVTVFRLTANVAFANSSGAVRSYGFDNRFTTYPGTAAGVGPPVRSFVERNTKEVPTVNSSGEVVVTTADGSRTVLASNAKPTSTRLTAGVWNDSPSSVFYVETGSKDLFRATSNGTTTQVTANSDVEAQGVAGIADVDDDDADELVYGGNGPSGNSNSIIYIDDDGTVVGTAVGYGTNNNIGLGEPADFDGDGTARVPYVDGSNNIKLANSTGSTTQLTSNGVAAKAPIATGNFDDDDPLEIYFAGTNGNLRVLDNATVDNTVRTVTDGQGNTITTDNGVGVA